MNANKTNQDAGETAKKVLLLDFEMFANVSRTWGFYDQNVIKIVRHRMICCVGWKWLGQDRVYAKGLCDFPGYKGDRFNNLNLMRFTRELMDQADIIVGHNLDSFDIRRANTDMLKGGVITPAPYKTIDTLKIARLKFGFNQNSLNALCQFLGVPTKVKHPGFEMWEQCEEGSPSAWEHMKRYNRGDVDPCLEGVFRKMIPWYQPRWLQRMGGIEHCLP